MRDLVERTTEIRGIRLVNRAMQIALLTRVPTDVVREERWEWLEEFERKHGRPWWVKWISNRRLERRVSRWKEKWIAGHSDIIDVIQEKIREEGSNGKG